MRFITAATAAALLAFQAIPGFAQNSASPAPMAPPSTPAAPPVPAAPQASPVPDTMTPPSAHHARMSLQQRFDAANTTHDGHLTRQQADAAKWSYVSRHFETMDKDHKGYVTVDDIHAYSKSAHATRTRHAKPAHAASAPAAPVSGQAGQIPSDASPARSPAPPAPSTP